MAIELPEAQRLAQQIDAALKGKDIAGVLVPERAAALVRQGFINLHTTVLARTTVAGAYSRGKWIFVGLEPGRLLLFALETGGRLLYHPTGFSGPATYQARIDFTDGACLTVHIAGWGFAKTVLRRELAQETYPGKLGISPLDDFFTLSMLGSMLDNAAPHLIQQVIMDQRVLAGIGSGYAQDVLFRAGLHPKRTAGSLDSGEMHRLYDAIRTTLSLAMAQGGRTGEVDLYGHPGGYQPVMDAAHVGRPCPICATPIIQITVLGASTSLCPTCQR
jgi:formamidopyrimidine-DNA glycosylase